MIQTKELKTREDFINLKKGDVVACEFHRDVHDYPKTYRFKVFTIAENKQPGSEIILQKRTIYTSTGNYFLEKLTEIVT